MRTKRELLERWETEPGCSIRKKLYDLASQLWPRGHGIASEVILTLLDGLPYRGDVPGGGDLRGLQFGAVRELDFRGWDFSHGNPNLLIDCDLRSALFDYAVIGCGVGTFSNTMNGASFFSAFFDKCCFDGSPARGCDFEKARLKKCDLSGMDLTGSRFRGAKLTDGSIRLADLRGCDFRGAILDRMVIHGVHWDKTTDLRGATLLNVMDEEYQDNRYGVIPAADWRQTNYDETTRYTRDPSIEVVRTISAAIAAAGELRDPIAPRLSKVLRDMRDQVRKHFNENWREDLQQQLTEDEKALLEQVFDLAVEYLK